MKPLIHLLHVFPTFRAGGAQARFVTIANHLGSQIRHSVIAVDGNYEAADMLASEVRCDLLPPPPTKNSFFAPFYYANLLRTIRPDVMETYNWGAMDAVMGGLLVRTIPVIHTEDGFGRDEAIRIKGRRVLARRVLLNRIHKTVFPSNTLHRIALQQYRIDTRKLQLIVNGVDTDRFYPRRSGGLRAELGIAESELVVGTVGRFSAEKNLPMLVRAFADALIGNARLVLVGDGGEKKAICEAVRDAGLNDRVILTGSIADPSPYYGIFDIFAMSSHTEQMPIALLEAMSSGLPAICTNVGDSADILKADTAPEIVNADDHAGYASALRTLAADPLLRRRLGTKNRQRCVTSYSLDAMIQSYLALYRTACDVSL
jgi:glycosyltransferase involved in cell wall biosynthesis